MRFFTPEMLIRFRSEDDDVADLADEEWHSAIQSYNAYLGGLGEQLPPQVRGLADLCLHDAEILACDPPNPSTSPASPGDSPSLDSGLAVLSSRLGDEIVSLCYLLWGDLRKHDPSQGWGAAYPPTLWLYEEVEVVAGERGFFIHKILLSDGSILEIPFRSVVVQRISLKQGSEHRPPRRIA